MNALTEQDFERLRDLARSHLGVRFPENKRAMMQARISRRQRELGLSTAREYCEYLFGEGQASGELEHFLDVTTTHVTYFFREPQQLERLDEEYLAPLIQRADREGRPLRVWSAACSTGEEVWTLGIMVDAVARRVGVTPRVELVGTDVSNRVLMRALRAVYPEADLEKVDPELRARHFLRSKNRARGEVRVVSELRQQASFRPFNLMSASYPVPTGQDLVLLRNALIYFDRPTQEQIVSRVATHVRPGGLFCVGLTESLHGFDVGMRHRERSIYCKETS